MNEQLSFLLQKIIYEWLEELEDAELLTRIEEIERDSVGYLSHEEFWDLYLKI